MCPGSAATTPRESLALEALPTLAVAALLHHLICLLFNFSEFCVLVFLWKCPNVSCLIFFFFLHREKKIEGLNSVRCLSAYHATVLSAKLHETSLAVAQEVKLSYPNISPAIGVCLMI